MIEWNDSFTTGTLFLIIAATLLVGCDDNTLDPIDRDRGLYGIYGALNLNNEVNYIRVKDLNAGLTAEATDTIDATVTLENLETGVIDTLPSTRLQFEDIYLHNFIVNRPISPDTPYRVRAERSDGKSTSIETLTPTMPVPVAGPENQACNTPVTVTFDPTNGGTIILRIGIPFETRLGPIYWATPQELKDDASGQGNIEYTFSPEVQVDVIPPSLTNGRDLECTDLNDDEFLISFSHYAPGFYEKIDDENFDIVKSTDRFGAFYRDTLAVTVDIFGSSVKQ